MFRDEGFGIFRMHLVAAYEVAVLSQAGGDSFVDHANGVRVSPVGNIFDLFNWFRLVA